eukprot:CAMPEP_0117479644 /NCGR_PEP_ID=MMETSP0784-20121206/11989_1 /TAXON_ID=39447 /ORGANISM="" /LENGTH=156 /DNA_ID=CAMNT_0005274073 /DNA_START=76 /DNA_END=543 /DNA_ORIENTATION=+
MTHKLTGIIRSAFRLDGTVLPMVLVKPEFYIFLGLNFFVAFSLQTGYYNPDQYHAQMTLKVTEITGHLMTFALVFYSGNVFSRYQKLYELTKGMIENSMYIVSIAARELNDIDVVRQLARWLLCSSVVFVFERQSYEEFLDDDGFFTEVLWSRLAR